MISDNCPECGGLEYQLESTGEWATAIRCPACLTDCTLCGNTGLLEKIDSSGYRVYVPCECRDVERRLTTYNRAQFPARYAGKNLENFEERAEGPVSLKYELLTLRNQFHPGDSGLVLWGSPGTGKTHLMTAFLSYLTLERGLPCRFIDFGDLTTRIKRGYDRGLSENEVIDDLVNIPILCIDELGKGRGSDWEISVLDALVNRRYNAQRSTFFTTNFPVSEQEGGPRKTDSGAGKRIRNPFNPNELEQVKTTLGLPNLEERVGSRIYSRLVEMCSFRHVTGSDYRRK